MHQVIQLVLCLTLSYLTGSVNPAYILGKLKGFDIRENGSGNAGASNVVITMGKKAGLFTALFDIAKAYIIIKLSFILFPALKFAHVIAGVGCIFGHIFPIFMNFHGGKGLACLGGVVLSFSIKVFVVLLLCELVLALICDYICVVPITASMIYPVIYGIITRSLLGSALFLPATCVILYKHIENLKRIRQGTEAHFSWLWNKEAEEKRLRDNFYK